MRGMRRPSPGYLSWGPALTPAVLHLTSTTLGKMIQKLGLLLLVSGALCQHQVTQQITQHHQLPLQSHAERQIGLDDIERDGLKSAAAQQQPAAYQQQAAAYQQQQQQPAYQQQQAAVYQQQPTAVYQQAYQHPNQPAAFYHPQFQIAPAATAYQPTQIALHPASQQLFPAAGGAYHQQYIQPVYLQPQAHHSYQVPFMIIPYHGLQQELVYPGINKLRTPIAAAPAAAAATQQLVAAQPQAVPAPAKFRPSPQIQYPSPYSSQVYQQKFATGVKSTPAPTVKDNYVQQQQGFNYKLQ